MFVIQSITNINKYLIYIYIQRIYIIIGTYIETYKYIDKPVPVREH